MKKQNSKTFTFLFAIALLLFSGSALADGEVITNIRNQFETSISAWWSPLQQVARWLLITLATISYAWSAIQMVLRNADLNEFVTEFIRLVMFTGFFLFLIENAPSLANAMINGWVWIAGHATGSNAELSVPEIFTRGLEMSKDIWGSSSGWTDAVPYMLLAIIILIIYTLISAFAFFVVVEMYVVTAAGIILLGFGGSQWTVDYAKRYLTYCFSVGAKLYVLFLVVGVGEQFINTWAETQDPSNLTNVLSLAGVLLMMLILIKMIPDVVQAIINGAALGSGTPSMGGMAAAATGAAAGAVTGGIGSAMAVKAASSLASSQLGQAAGAVGTSGTGGGGTGGGGGGGSPLPKPSALAHTGATMRNLGSAAVGTAVGKIGGNPSYRGASFLGGMNTNLQEKQASLGAASTSPIAPSSDSQGSGGGGGGSIGAGADQSTGSGGGVDQGSNTVAGADQGSNTVASADQDTKTLDATNNKGASQDA